MAQDQILWTEKYRPHKIADCILPSDLKETFQGFVDNGEMPNLLLCGSAGCGKTTVAKALCDEMGIEYLFINASLEGNIDTLRTKIQKYASSVSLMSTKRKFVILDEADYLNKQSTQPALRAFMEEFSSNCGFIMTCNYQNRLIEPLWSRSTVIEFKYPSKGKDGYGEICKDLYRRLSEILDSEEVTYDSKVLAKIIVKYYPDFRRILNELQRHSTKGEIGSNALVSDFSDISALVSHLKEKNFPGVRQWCAENNDVETSHVFKKLFDQLCVELQNHSIPQAVVILNEGQKAAAIVADRELNMCATFVELMASAEFR
jgi:DNA polymerase III delta prime subunit